MAEREATPSSDQDMVYMDDEHTATEYVNVQPQRTEQASPVFVRADADTTSTTETLEPSSCGTSAWQAQLCACCNVKDCGLTCCVANIFCGPCVFSSAMEAAKLGPCAPDLRCTVWCCGAGLFPPLTYAWARRSTAAQYGIDESVLESCALACCCTCAAKTPKPRLPETERVAATTGCAYPRASGRAHTCSSSTRCW
eukprot:562258-Prymnesium_polylepis.1